MTKTVLFGMFILLLSACELAQPCGDKDQFLENFEDFVAKVGEEKRTYSDAQWEQYDRKLERFVEACYQKHKEDLTTEEEIAVVGHSMKYAFHRYGLGVLRDLADDDTRNRVVTSIREELLDDMDNMEEELDVLIKEITNSRDWDAFFKDLEREAEDFSKKIEEIFE